MANRFNTLLVGLLLGLFSITLPASGQRMIARTLAGDVTPLDGPALAALFISPWQIKVRDSLAYIADKDYGALRELNIRTRTVRTLVSNVKDISGLAISRTGDSIFFSSHIYRISLYRRSTQQWVTLDTLADGEIDALECLRNGSLLIGSAAGHRVLMRKPDSTYQVLAGKLGAFGFAEGLDTLARFNRIASILPSLTEDTIFITDRFNSRIRRLIRSTRMVSSLPLGNLILGPRQLAFSRNRDSLFIANSSGHTLVRFSLRTNTGGAWVGLAGSPGLVDGNTVTTRFNFPMGIARSDSGWLVCDNVNRRIRLVSFGGISRTFAGGLILGDGNGINSRFNTPYDVVKHPLKDTLYVSDQNNNAIRFINLRNMDVKTLAGNGQLGNVQGIGTAARFNRPSSMAISENGDTLFVVEPFGNKIRMVLTRTAEVRWLAGSDTAGNVDKPQGRFSRFNRPSDIAYKNGFLYVADANNHRIRRIKVSTSAVSTFAGSTSGFKDSTLLGSRFNRPSTLEWVGERLFIGEDAGLRIRLLEPDSNRVRNWAGNGNIGTLDGLGAAARFKGIFKLSYDPAGKRLLVGGYLNEGICRTVGTEIPQVLTLLNQTGYADGELNQAQFTGPLGFWVDSARRRYILADANNQRIRQIDWFPNSAPSATFDTSTVFLNEDQEPGFINGAASNFSPGTTRGDTLQSVALSTTWQPTNRLINANLDNDGNLFLQTRTDSIGTVRIRVRLFDGGGTQLGGTDTAVYFRTVVIRPVNDPPRVVLAGNDTADFNQPRIRPNFLVSSTPGPWDEGNQSLTFTLTADQPDWFSVQPLLEGTSLQYTPVSGQIGTTSVRLVIRDNGGLDLSGVDSTVLNFTITLRDPNSIERKIAHRFQVFPNPARDMVRIENLPPGCPWIGLYSLQGKEVLRLKAGKTWLSADLRSIPSGLYLLKGPGLAGQKLEILR